MSEAWSFRDGTLDQAIFNAVDSVINPGDEVHDLCEAINEIACAGDLLYPQLV